GDPARGDHHDARAARAAAAAGVARRPRGRARGDVVGRMRRLTGAVALAWLLVACGSSSSQLGLSLKVDTSPFRLTLAENGKTVVAEDKDARLRYQVRPSGNQFSLTKVLSSSGNVYQVATNEPGRTATVTLTRGTSGFHVSVRFHPDTNVEQVYDAFDTAKGDHFLGGGERGGGVDLRGQVLSVKVSNVCSYAPVPYFSSSAGWGVRIATPGISALAFPGSPGGGGCRFGDHPQCTFPALPHPPQASLPPSPPPPDPSPPPLP